MPNIMLSEEFFKFKGYYYPELILIKSPNYIAEYEIVSVYTCIKDFSVAASVGESIAATSYLGLQKLTHTEEGDIDFYVPLSEAIQTIQDNISVIQYKLENSKQNILLNYPS